MPVNKIKEKMVYVEFRDHYSLPSDWYAVSSDHGSRVIKCIGFLYEETDEMIFLASVYDKKANMLSGGIAVLKNSIQKIIYLKAE